VQGFYFGSDPAGGGVLSAAPLLRDRIHFMDDPTTIVVNAQMMINRVCPAPVVGSIHATAPNPMSIPSAATAPPSFSNWPISAALYYLMKIRRFGP
jgi:hypothetical protein